MNKAAKKRLMVVGLVILVVALVLFAVLGSGGTAATLTVKQALSGDYEGRKVQVSGPVVNDSYIQDGTNSVFRITDDEGSGDLSLQVVFTGAMPATFGNGVTAICTGTVQDGSMVCADLVTKCPSKYESAEGAVTAKQLTTSPGAFEGLEVKLAGYVTPGSMADINADVRFNVYSQGSSLDVVFDGALPDGMEDDTAVIVTGALNADATAFVATDVAIDAAVKKA